jgi:tetratricopeptide (TPR) repeat protein
MLHRKYRYHRLRPRLWGALLLLAAAWILASILQHRYGAVAPGLHWVEQIASISAIIVLALTLALQIFSFWYSVTLRYLAWCMARAGGTAWRWLTSGWRLPAVWLIGVSTAWFIRSIFLSKSFLDGKKPPHSNDLAAALANLFVFSTIWKILVITILIVFVAQIYRATRRIVVVAFANHAGSEFNSCVAELPARLLNDLRRLSDIYQTVDEEGRPIGASSVLVGPKASTGDIGEDVRGAVGSDAKLEFGPIKIPIGAIVGVFTRIARGPQLTGSLHREGRRLILLARIDGRIEGSWRVAGTETAEVKSAADAGAAVEPMLAELVYRVFTDMTDVGSPKWQAVRCYSEGLRAYRRTLRTKQEFQVRLRQARSLFIEAHSEDDKFARCYYNLGVVDQNLDKIGAARAAYQSALARDPTLVDAAYALAWIYWTNEDHSNALQYSERAISINPDDARPWNLRGLALARLKKRALPDGQEAPADEGWWAEIAECCEIAAALAWRELCCAGASGRSLESAKEVAQYCLNNAAFSHFKCGRVRNGISILRQALILRPVASLYFELGDYLEKGGYYAKAARARHSAVVLEPDIEMRAKYWAYLAGSEAARLVNSKPAPGSGDAAIAAKLAPGSGDAAIAAKLAPGSGDAAIAAKLAPGSGDAAIATKPAPGSGDATIAAKLAPGSGDAAIAACQGAMTYPSALTGDALVRLWSVLKFLTAEYGKVDQRINELRTHLAHALTALRALGREDAGKDRIERLQRLLDWNDQPVNKNSHFYSWARGRLEIELGSLYLGNQEWAKAESRFTRALKELEKDYPEDVRNFSVKAMLARALNEQDKLDESLMQARSASLEYSDNSDDWAVLGQIFYAKKDFKNALEAWETAIVLKPRDSDNYKKVFAAYVSLAMILRNPAQRTELLRKGIGFAETVADLGDQETVPGDQETVAWAHFWSARLSIEVLDFDRAITHWNIIQDDKATKCLVAYFLGDANLRRGDYDSSFDAFAKATKETWREIRRIRAKKGAPLHAFHQSVDDFEGWPVGAVLCHSLLGLACGYAERDVGFDTALRRISMARKYAPKLRGCRTLDINWERRVIAYCDDCEGWIIIRRHIATPDATTEPALKKRRTIDAQHSAAGHRGVDRAIELIRKALASQLDVQFYYHLAVAYAYKFAAIPDSGEWQRWSELAVINIDHARELDLSAEYQSRLAALSDRLKRQCEVRVRREAARLAAATAKAAATSG